MTEFIPRSYFAPLDLPEVFGRTAPVEVDLGCGDGTFLCDLAETNPARDFLGVERLFGRSQSACRRAMQRELTNVRVLRVESGYAVRYLLPPQSIEVIYLLFPDPWPKKRHHRRRIVTREFLIDLSTALMPAGLLSIATDNPDYFAEILRLVRASEEFAPKESPTLQLPETTFERRFKGDGTAIHRLRLRKISP